MKTILLAWNPNRYPWDELQDKLSEIQRHGQVIAKWSVGNRRYLDEGTRFFLIRLGVEPRGLVGSGWVTSKPYNDRHWDSDRAQQGKTTQYVNIYFDVLDERPLVSIDELKQHSFTDVHWSTQMSGIEIPSTVANEIEVLWSQRSAKGISSGVEELPTVGAVAVKHSERVYVNKYERSAKARALCLAHYGLKCVICNTLLSDVYGSAAGNLIHVHHLTPLADIPEGFQIDPVKDLRPVCPNCHSVIHTHQPHYSPDEVSQMISERQRKR